jgi:hypothetical protein
MNNLLKKISFGGFLMLIGAAGAPAQSALTALGSLARAAGYSAPGAAAAALRSPGYVDLLGGIAYTSNALLTEQHPVDDGIGIVGLDIDYVHQGPQLLVDALGNIDRLEYVKGSFPGTFYGEFLGNAIFGQPTDIFQWQAQDAFGEGMLNPLTAPTPQNLQTVNYARTGPIVNFNMGTSNRLTISGLYARTNFESSPYDSQSYEGSASFRHTLSTVSSFSIQATDVHTEFLDSRVGNEPAGAGRAYDTRAASAGYTSEFGRTKFLAYGGYNTVNYGGPERGAPLAVVQFNREISLFSTLFLTGETGYSTLGNSLLSPSSGAGTAAAGQILGTGIGANTNTVTPAPFKNTAGTLGWNYHRLRTTITLLGTASEQHYVSGSNFDQTSETISASLRRQLGPTLFVQIQGIETFGHFGVIGADNRTTTGHLSLSKEFRHAILTGYAQWRKQRSTNGNSGIEVASYTDERVGIELTYDLVGHKGLQNSAGLGTSF